MAAFDGFIFRDGDEVATTMAVSGIGAFIGGDADGEAMMAVVGDMEGEATMAFFDGFNVGGAMSVEH